MAPLCDWVRHSSHRRFCCCLFTTDCSRYTTCCRLGFQQSVHITGESKALKSSFWSVLMGAKIKAEKHTKASVHGGVLVAMETVLLPGVCVGSRALVTPPCEEGWFGSKQSVQQHATYVIMAAAEMRIYLDLLVLKMFVFTKMIDGVFPSTSLLNVFLLKWGCLVFLCSVSSSVTVFNAVCV